MTSVYKLQMWLSESLPTLMQEMKCEELQGVTWIENPKVKSLAGDLKSLATVAVDPKMVSEVSDSGSKAKGGVTSDTVRSRCRFKVTCNGSGGAGNSFRSQKQNSEFL